MKKSKRLDVIVNLNAEKEKKILNDMGEVQSQRQQAQSQLKNLTQYRQEYHNNYSPLGKTSTSVTQFLDFRAFIEKLDKAIADQKQIVLNLDKNVFFAKKVWEQQHQKTTSLKKVHQSALTEEEKLEDIKEQKEQDDRSSRIGNRSGTKSVYN